ncbi:Hsp20/alpha crystallin family protein [Paenibacillus sp. CFBP13512]|uniref:Hsp20/alpha crystallin family protein n=1 Tax=Paenibacillus sp. CFBP13512 TaxID=2184007 RepID=UPI0010BFFB67|nr:Hsp20/alpha crystallin family protein [Paenibacillus sp. CFBP13512]TKJ90192.1 Hsp20/alpha crystallin family protein [Paenibacillus sp. CFBP13512]
MFDLVPFGKRREDMLSQWMKSFEDDLLTPFKGSTLSFRTDIRENEKAYLVEAELPGLQKENIDIDYAAPYLTIKAVQQQERQEENTDQRMVRKERRYGEYVRRFYVQDIEEDQIQATLKDGILLLTIPKKQRSEGRRIQIDGSSSTARLEDGQQTSSE